MTSKDERLEAFLSVPTDTTLPEPPAPYRAGLVDFDGRTGTLGTGTLTTPIGDWADILSVWGLDPNLYEVVGDTVRMSAWDSPRKNGDAVRLYAYRAAVRHRVLGPSSDLDQVLRNVDRWKPRRPVANPDRPALVVPLSDWQVGKAEGGGTVALLDRLYRYLEHILARVAADKPSEVVFICLGDLVEGCFGHYPMQQWSVELDAREQARFVRRVIVEYVTRTARLVPVRVLAVPGNHGENRVDGKAVTTWTDNTDLAVVEQSAEVLADRPNLQPIRWSLAEGLELVDIIGGVAVGAFHGHAARAADPKRFWDFIGRSAVSGRPIGRAQLFFTGHYHHTVIDESTTGTWFQAPAADGGSAWYSYRSGNASRPGLMLVNVGAGCGPRGWSNVEVVT